MTRIFEIRTICPAKEPGAGLVHSMYRVCALDVEKAIAKAKKNKNWMLGPEKVMSVILLAETQ